MGYDYWQSYCDFSNELKDGTISYGWKTDPPLTPFAPSYVHYFSEKKIFSEKECKEWNTYLLGKEQALLDELRTTKGDGNTGLGGISITSRHLHFNVLKFGFPLVAKLKTEILKGVCSLLDVSDNKNWDETLYANSWFNVLRQGEGMDTHSHGYHKNTFYGFHLTVSAIETFTSYYHPIKFQEEAFHVPNKVGYLTLFPNFVPHSVSPNRYDTHRISIAGDIYASTWLEEESSIVHNKNLVELGACK